MTDKKWTDESVPVQTTWSADDLMMVVDKPGTDPTSTTMALDDLFTEIVTGVNIKTVNGLNCTPGSNVDCDLITCDVTNNPKIWYDISETAIRLGSDAAGLPWFHAERTGVCKAPEANSLLAIGGVHSVNGQRGVTIAFTNDHANGCTAIQCDAFGTHGTNDIATISGFSSRAAHNSSGTLGNCNEIAANGVTGTGGVVGNRRGVYVADSNCTGTITTQYGIQIANLAKGGTNWSIYTGTAPSSFGGMLTCAAGLTVNGGQDIVLSATTGTKIGTGNTQKLGFWNATPVVQQTVAADATVGTLIAALTTMGLIKNA